MKIEHIAMYVEDLEKMRNFYITFFEARSNNGYHNIKTGFKSYFLTFEDGARLEIMNMKNMETGSKEIMKKGYIHLAMSVGSKERVDILTREMANAGYSVISMPRITGDGYYESCVLDPENNQIEITI